MMKSGSLIIAFLFLCILTGISQPTGNVKYVDPFIGTAGPGHTYPGATTPFGMVQVSPETGNLGWNYCSGYHYEDKSIMGFSNTHLSGTGWMDLGDILLMSFTGPVRKKTYNSLFTHDREKASPGFYFSGLLCRLIA
jgi:putative alpha-1,2-mannosidase